jgi:mannosyltransferase
VTAQTLYRSGFTLALITALAAALRLYGLDIQSLWNDELSYLYRTQGQGLIAVLRSAKSDTHPPLYHLIVWVVSNRVGDDAIHLRLPSAVFGILAVYSVYALARDVYDRRAGLFAAATLAVSYTALFFSQEGRPNSLIALLTILSTHAAFDFAQAVSGDEEVPRPVGLRLCLWSILLSYTHYFGILSVVAQALALFVLCLVRVPHRLKSLILWYLAIAAAYLPWLPVVILQLKKGPIWIQEPGLNDVLGLLSLLVKGITVPVGLAVLVMAAAAVRVLRTYKVTELDLGPVGPFSVLVFVLVIPPILAFALSYLVVPIFEDRNLIGMLTMICVIVGVSLSWGVDTYGAGLGRWQLIELLIIALLIGVSLRSLITEHHYYSTPNKGQIREAVNALVSASQLQKAPVAAFCANNVKYLTYYSSRAGWHGRFGPKLCSLSDLSASDMRSGDGSGQLWFIWAHLMPDPPLIAELQKLYSVTLMGKYLKAQVYRLEPRAAP